MVSNSDCNSSLSDFCRLIAAEETVLSRGGSVVRLAGLYTESRGPHTYWIKNGTVGSNADGLVNTLQYDDVLNQQRKAIYDKRHKVLANDTAFMDELLAKITDQVSLNEKKYHDL